MTAPYRANPPFRAEHVGSLLRPDSLRQAYRDFSGGRIDAAAFRGEQERAIREVVDAKGKFPHWREGSAPGG